MTTKRTLRNDLISAAIKNRSGKNHTKTKRRETEAKDQLLEEKLKP